MPPTKAALACQNCRRLKRKCTRELPFCSLCVRLGKGCHYPPKDARTGSDNTLSIGADSLLTSLEGSINSGGVRPDALASFPKTFFLDPDFFIPLGVNALSSATLTLVPTCFASLGMDLVSICHAYVATTNKWFPILSPKRLFHDVSNIQLSNPDPSLVLLLCCIRLISLTDYFGPCPEYKLAKALSSQAENEGIVSLRLIQSVLLLAAYEIGHGIYPAAYLTLSRAARLGVLAGLGQDGHVALPRLFKIGDSLTLREEERRTSWGNFMLDRFVHIAAACLPWFIPQISATALSLPVSDRGWSKGELDTAESSLVLASIVTDLDAIGRYATTCQASHLFCHALKHRTSYKKTESLSLETLQLDEALQLHRTLTALDERLPMDDTEEANLEALALICSARYIVYNMYSCNEIDVRSDPEKLRREVEVQRVSVNGVMDVSSRRVPQMAQKIIELLAAGEASYRGRDISPFVVHCLYHAATECGWFIREGCGPEMSAGLAVIMSALDQLKTSWPVAVDYWSLLAKEETVAGLYGLH